jgi:hypothetical protein
MSMITVGTPYVALGARRWVTSSDATGRVRLWQHALGCSQAMALRC